MTNKLVVIINSLKLPKIRKILLYEMKFLVPNYSCLQNPWLWGYRPQIPVLSVLCPQLNLLNPTPNKIPVYATAWHHLFACIVGSDKHSSDVEKSYTDTQVTQVTKGTGQFSVLHAKECTLRKRAAQSRHGTLLTFESCDRDNGVCAWCHVGLSQYPN